MVGMVLVAHYHYRRYFGIHFQPLMLSIQLAYFHYHHPVIVVVVIVVVVVVVIILSSPIGINYTVLLALFARP